MSRKKYELGMKVRYDGAVYTIVDKIDAYWLLLDDNGIMEAGMLKTSLELDEFAEIIK